MRAPLELHSDEWLPADSGELAELLREGVELPISAATVTRLVHEWLVTEPPHVVEVRSGRRIGEGLVNKVERRIAELRRIDDFVAGGDLRGLVEQELHATASLLREANYSEPLGRRLLAAIGELCQLAGWVVGDAGRYDTAARYYTVGVQAAHAAGSPGRALFKERLAWAFAKTGERRPAERALAAVETAFEHSAPDDDPEWVYWLDEEEITVMAGRCYVELGQAGRAVPLLSGVLGRYDERRKREPALYTSWLAEAHLQLGAIDEAAAAATRTLELTSRTTSARSGDRTNVLRRKLQQYKDVPAVADFEALARESA